jgi:uncharacterized protein (TIGR03545 family)
MIRWRFVLTRLIIIVAVVVLLRWGVGSVARYATVRGLQAITGAKVEIASTRIGFFPPLVQFVDVAIADPSGDKEMRDVIRASGIDFAIDGDALMHRRWVAREARITGLQIGASRETSGHLAPMHRDDGSHGPSMLSRLLAATTDGLTLQAEAVVGSLETVQRSKEIRARWELEFSGLVDRARNLEAQIRAVSDQAQGIENPLRDWPKLEQTLAQSRQVRNELLSVRRDIDSLPERLQADLELLDEARQIDLAKVDRFIPGDLAGASEFGIDMMVDEVRAQVWKVRSYLEHGQSLANMTIFAPEADTRTRGVKHDLSRTDRPKWMIRRCELDGVVRANGKLYEMTGIVDNLTPTPQLLAEPTRARLRLEGPEVVRVEYVRDRRNAADVGLLTLHWPQTPAKPIRLGKDKDAGISISGGEHELWVQIRTQGDRIDGRLVSKQTGVEMGLSVDPKFADSAAAVAIRQTLSAVDRIEVDANFAGNWKDLDLKVNSNLSQILRRAGQDAIDGPIRQTKARLVALVDKAHEEQKLALRQWLESQQNQARSLLVSADKSIEEMSQRVLDGGPDAYLGNLRSRFGIGKK